MHLRRAVLGILISSLISPMARSASRPDFSGAWELDAPSAARVTLTIKQTPAEVTIETRSGASDVLTYKLDGSETTVAGASGTPITTRARWEGAKLVTETARTVNGAAVTTMHVLSLNSTGRELTVEKTLMVQHGYRSLVPRNTGSGKEVYLRAKAPTRR